MPPLADFMESLTQEQDKLVQMSTIQSTKDQYIYLYVWNKSKRNTKSKYLKQQEKKKIEKPKSWDGGSKPSHDKEKKKKVKK